MINIIKNKWKDILVIIGIIFIFLYFFSPNKEIVEVPVKIEVPVPVIQKEFDTIYEPKPIYKKGKNIVTIDSAYYNKYINLKDSISKNNLYKEAITIREYDNKFEDEFIIINTYSKTRGTLLEITSNYKTKPRNIILDTVINVPIPTKAKVFIGVGTGINIPAFDNNTIQPVFKGGLHLLTKKDRLISLEIDSQGRIWGSYAIKL